MSARSTSSERTRQASPARPTLHGGAGEGPGRPEPGEAGVWPYRQVRAHRHHRRRTTTRRPARRRTATNDVATPRENEAQNCSLSGPSINVYANSGGGSSCGPGHPRSIGGATSPTSSSPCARVATISSAPASDHVPVATSNFVTFSVPTPHSSILATWSGDTDNDLRSIAAPMSSRAWSSYPAKTQINPQPVRVNGHSRRRRSHPAQPPAAAGAQHTNDAAQPSPPSSTPAPPAAAATSPSTPARNGTSTTTTPATATWASRTRPATSGTAPTRPTANDDPRRPRSRARGHNVGTTTRPSEPSSSATNASSISATASGNRWMTGRTGSSEMDSPHCYSGIARTGGSP